MKRPLEATDFVTDEFLILKRRPLRDNEDVVEGLSRCGGRLSCVVRRSRRQSAVLEPPTLVRARFRRSDHLDILSQPEMLQPFLQLRHDLQRLLAAGFLGRLFLASLPEREPAEEVFELLQQLFEALQEGVLPQVCGIWGQDRLLSLLGVEPELEYCVECGSEDVDGFSSEEGGVLCAGCYSGTGFALSAAAIEFARDVRHSGLRELRLSGPEDIMAVGRLYKEQFVFQVGVGSGLFKRVLPPREVL